MNSIAWASSIVLGADEPAGGLQQLVVFMPVVLIMVLYVFLIQRPQRREQMVREQMIKNLKKNDRVLTTSGIYGVVASVQADADEVTIKVDEASNTKMRMTLGAIARVMGGEAGDKDTNQ